MLQADSAVQQKEEELEQLKEVINKLINEAGARTRQEVPYLLGQNIPEGHWSCITHLSAEDMLKSVVIEEKKFKNI